MTALELFELTFAISIELVLKGHGFSEAEPCH